MVDPTPREVALAHVSHSYGRRSALTDVSLTLPVGVTGLLGPNGAGKSTLMKLLATATTLFAGLLTVQGYRLAPELIPRVDGPHSALAFTGTLLTVAVGLAAFRLSRSGTRPLIG